jgi:hypothetical protein
MEALLIVYFCLMSDITQDACNKYTTSSWSFKVTSCDTHYIREQIDNMIKNETSTIEYEVTDFACYVIG